MNADHADISIVLDRSGSMASVAHDTIGGFNQFLSDQQKAPGSATISLMQFDDIHEVVYEAKPIGDAPKLSPETFKPRGSTALLDAIGQTINRTGKRLSDMPEQDRPGKVVFVILTDGMENASREFNRDKVFKMISEQRDKYQWEFVFIGANQDAIATAASMGIAAANSLSYANNSVGTQSAFAAASAGTTRLRSGGSRASYFSQSDRDAQKAAGASH